MNDILVTIILVATTSIVTMGLYLIAQFIITKIHSKIQERLGKILIGGDIESQVGYLNDIFNSIQNNIKTIKNISIDNRIEKSFIDFVEINITVMKSLLQIDQSSHVIIEDIMNKKTNNKELTEMWLDRSLSLYDDIITIENNILDNINSTIVSTENDNFEYHALDSNMDVLQSYIELMNTLSSPNQKFDRSYILGNLLKDSYPDLWVKHQEVRLFDSHIIHLIFQVQINKFNKFIKVNLSTKLAEESGEIVND